MLFADRSNEEGVYGDKHNVLAVKTKSETRKHGGSANAVDVDKMMDDSYVNDKGFEWDLIVCTDYTWAPGTPDVAAKAADKAAAQMNDRARKNGYRKKKDAWARAAQRARISGPQMTLD